MPEHYTRNTEQCTAYCRVCKRDTQHRVDDGRRGPCLEHQRTGLSKKQEAAQKKRAKEQQNPKLF